MKKMLLISCLTALCLFSYAYAADQIYVDNSQLADKVYQSKPEGWQDRAYTQTGSRVIDPGHEQHQVVTQPSMPSYVESQHEQQHNQAIREQENRRMAIQRANIERAEELLRAYPKTDTYSDRDWQTDNLKSRVDDLERNTRMGW